MNTIRIETVYLHVTNACKLRCSYCYLSASQPLADELNTNEFAVLFPELVLLSPQRIVFTGGEPLLRPDFFDLLEKLRNADTKHSIFRCINTSGHEMTPNVAARLVGLIDEVRVSIDALMDRNDEIRGMGAFASAMRAIESLIQVDLEPRIQITVTRHSLPDLEELLRLLISKGLTRINLSRFRPIGRGADKLDWSVSESEIEETIAHAWQRLHPKHLLPLVQPKTKCQKTCGVGHYVNIMPNGDVFPCHVLFQKEFLCGNIRTTPLSSICTRQSLIGRLANVDFAYLAQIDPRLAKLTTRGICMGEIYAQQKESSAWSFVAG